MGLFFNIAKMSAHVFTLSALQLEESFRKVNTDAPQSCWSNKLHELVVAHVTQEALQTALAFTSKQKTCDISSEIRVSVFWGAFLVTGLKLD